MDSSLVGLSYIFCKNNNFFVDKDGRKEYSVLKQEQY